MPRGCQDVSSTYEVRVRSNPRTGRWRDLDGGLVDTHPRLTHQERDRLGNGQVDSDRKSKGMAGGMLHTSAHAAVQRERQRFEMGASRCSKNPVHLMMLG